MTTSRKEQLSTECLFLAIELSLGTWKLAFAAERGQKARRRDIRGGDVAGLQGEITRAKERFGLAAQARVVCCYEAGRDGFWIHRYLREAGMENVVVDSSSIEVNRRQRRAKSDRLDAEKLLTMLIRWQQGEEHVWSVLRVPSEEDEDGRRPDRELDLLKAEQTRHSNRIKGWLFSVGVRLEKIDRTFAERLAALRQWNGQALPPHLQQQLLREFRRMQLVNEQIRGLEAQRAQEIREAPAHPQVRMVRRLLEIRGIGVNSAWRFVKELFGWRQFDNRRQLAAAVGLAPTPFSSGASQREQGISKSGNRRLRAMAIEIAWGWLRFQPGSRIRYWYLKRFASGSKRQRRIGIVALARKLMILLWRYLKDGDITDGFTLRGGLPPISYTASLS